MDTFIIYGLIDPFTNELRYVGKSTSGLRRPRMHLWPSNLKKKRWVYNWLRQVLAQGGKPEIVVLESHDNPHELYEAEQWFISYYRSLGCRLTNCSDGGPGWSGSKPIEVCIKISNALRGRKIGPPSKIHRQRLREANLGKKKSDETRVRMSEAKGGRSFYDHTGRLHVSIQQAARDLGLHATHICKVLKGRLKSTGGYRFIWDRPS